MRFASDFFARRDDFHAVQPEGRKIVAQCASTGRKTVPPQPRTGRKKRSGPFLRPVPGLANAPACYPRLCAVGYYLSPFGLCALSRLRLAAMWGSQSCLAGLPAPHLGSNRNPKLTQTKHAATSTPSSGQRESIFKEGLADGTRRALRWPLGGRSPVGTLLRLPISSSAGPTCKQG
jgi:hypothetical protein